MERIITHVGPGSVPMSPDRPGLAVTMPGIPMLEAGRMWDWDGGNTSGVDDCSGR